MAHQKILIVITSHGILGSSGKKTGFHLSELTTPYLLFTEAGFQVDIASPLGGCSPMDPVSYDLDNIYNKTFLETEAYVAQLNNTLVLSSIKPNEYVAVHFSGGPGTMWDFPNNPDVINIAASIYEQGGVVAAVCHGPAALVNVRLSDGEYLVNNKELTAFSNVEEEKIHNTKIVPFLLETKLIERGATYSKAGVFKEKVVSCNHLVTGQNPASAKGVADACLKVLKASLCLEENSYDK